MPRFFVDAAPVGDRLTITGEDAHHIVRVLRMKPGERLTVCDGAGVDYDCELLGAAGAEAACRILGQTPSIGEPSVRITLFMGLPKGDKMDFIVQKATELGASCVTPFLAARSVSRPDAKTLRKKCERWQKIAREAAMQSGRGRVPEIAAPVTQAEAAALAAQHDTALFFYENERQTGLRAALSGGVGQTAALMIGPEGGFAPEEVQTALDAGLTSVSLGTRILRCETAPLAALTALLYESGNI